MSLVAICGSYITPFSPTSISGLAIWLDGADPSGNGIPPTNGATVSTWSDKSGSSMSGTATGTPTFVSGGGILFDAAPNEYYTIPYSLTPSAETGFIVFKQTSSTASPQLLYAFNNGTREIVFFDNPTYSGHLFSAQVGVIAKVSFSNTGTNLFEWTFNSTSSSAYSNGTAGTAGGGFAAAAQTSMKLGSNFNGTTYDFVIFNRVLTTTEIQKMEGYLAWKWGIQSSLPAGHPYLSAPP
jgi:hypothetical protein